MRITEHRHIRGSRYSQRPRCRFTALVALALTLSSLTACRPTDGTPDDSGKPVLSPMSAEEARAIKIDQERPPPSRHHLRHRSPFSAGEA